MAAKRVTYKKVDELGPEDQALAELTEFYTRKAGLDSFIVIGAKGAGPFLSHSGSFNDLLDAAIFIATERDSEGDEELLAFFLGVAIASLRKRCGAKRGVDAPQDCERWNTCPFGKQITETLNGLGVLPGKMVSRES